MLSGHVECSHVAASVRRVGGSLPTLTADSDVDRSSITGRMSAVIVGSRGSAEVHPSLDNLPVITE